MLPDLLNWLNVNAGAVQGVSTMILVIVTIAYAKSAKRQADQAERQVEQIQQQRFDQHRPVVQPSGSLLLGQDNHLDLSKLDYDLALRNVGTGVALIVCGVLFPPEPKTPSGQLSTRYTLWRESPLLPGSPDRPVKLMQGVTRMNGTASIRGHQLFAPSKPSQWEMMSEGKYNVLARLTLTYEDIFRRKHAALFDYIDQYGWQCVALLDGIPKDLEDIN